MVASETRAADTTNEVAHGVLREAQQAAYRFPEGFFGFRAHVTITEATSGGTKTASGTVTVGGPRSIELALEGDETLAQWGKQEIGSVAGHRWPTSYEESDGRYGLVLDEDPHHPLGSQITFQDDPFASVYRVANGRISQVTRSMGSMRFTITMQRHSETPDGRALPSEFTVSYWNTQQDRLTRSDIYSDRYQVVENVSIPATRTIVTADDTGFTTRVLEFSDVQLLTELVQVETEGGERHGTRAG